jgi:hypothetical protein
MNQRARLLFPSRVGEIFSSAAQNTTTSVKKIFIFISDECERGYEDESE